MRVRVKVCGITRVQDALAVVELGADAVGFNFVAESPRRISPDIESIEDAVRRVAAALKCGGVAMLQFDTRSRSALYRFRNKLPDVVLPRPWRRGIRRIRRSPADVARILMEAGLAPVREEGKGTAEHAVILRKK